jgi:hypothetical protein
MNANETMNILPVDLTPQPQDDLTDAAPPRALAPLIPVEPLRTYAGDPRDSRHRELDAGLPFHAGDRVAVDPQYVAFRAGGRFSPTPRLGAVRYACHVQGTLWFALDGVGEEEGMSATVPVHCLRAAPAPVEG